MGYQGWTNHATWALMLTGINCEEATQKHWRDIARQTWREQRNFPDSANTNFSASESTRFALADAIKEAYEESLEEAQSRVADLNGPWQDFLRGGFDDVAWEECADSILRDCELPGYEPTKEYSPA